MTGIIINIQVEGLHSWPECNIKEVEFLKYPHRHIFHICCKKEVEHNDRDIEIIKFKRRIQRFLQGMFYHPEKGCLDFKNLSCEMIAKELLHKFNLYYCSVLEDGENGAEIFIK
jgi:hypothetical protein